MSKYDPNCAWWDVTCTSDPSGCAFWEIGCNTATDVNKLITPTENFIRNSLLIIVIGVVLLVAIVAFSPAGRHLIPRVSVK